MKINILKSYTTVVWSHLIMHQTFGLMDNWTIVLTDERARVKVRVMCLI